ncbi:2-oxo acid dehydrogenase subunit E2 [Mariniblastus fucicola]|uniref:Dihydrolipoamide acetyltransferase component of pyruvate dehydrogenase complex n=1 Tax=Mariniblastus fucicola TaxID=980251 RepID=A0A5B9P9Q3_9BACT|nr:2-oxo acid dehydrogenase subunit E2 [Mariniblastus fucicola]QEG23058.1 Dihydrolipoyllysine-residue acetyltransferase component of pyruvate dehydrogenase complex [Mariniblastus fucicola]
MAVEFKLPGIGEGIESGDVLDVLVSVGDTIEKDTEICELETDKATVFVPSDMAGTVTEIHIASGDTVSVGQKLLTVEAADGGSAPAAAAPAATPEPAAPPEPAPTPAPESKPEPAAATPPPAPAAPATPPPAAPTPAPAASGSKASVPAGPAIRRFAREVGVDLANVTGSGAHGRILRDDVLRVVRDGTAARPAASSSSPAVGAAGVGGAASLPGDSQTDAYGPVRIEKMPKIRQTIARKMHESWTTCPRVTNFDDADVTALEAIRQNSKADYKAMGISLTTMPFIIKAVAMALKQHPTINASVDLDAGQIIYKDYVNVGIAVDTDRGLVVPNMRNADEQSIPALAKGLSVMAENVRGNKFGIDDLRGGTFTISNLGAIGGTYSTPIINVPETAILLVGRSRKLPVVVENDEVAVRLMMPLSLSYDHRLIDGGAAARFLNEVIGYLEAPSRLLLAL